MQYLTDPKYKNLRQKILSKVCSFNSCYTTHFAAEERMSLGGDEKDCLARLREGAGAGKRVGREDLAARGGKEK